MVGANEADRIVRLKEVLVITGLSRSVLYRLCSQGAFPAQVDTGVKQATWRHSDVQTWIATRGAKAAA
jgi:prophage regulatory protein